MRRDVFQAIADPTRRQIIGMVSNQPLNVNELSGNFDITRTAVSKHIKILKECGLVKIQKQGRERYCRANLDGLAEVALWVSQYRMFWSDNLDRLEKLLNDDTKQVK